MKTKVSVLAAVLLASASFFPAYAGNILQPADGSAVAFEADIGVANIANNTTRVFWLATNDVTASGGTALYCATTNFPPLSGAQAGRPNSFVTYNINFSQAGTYYIYYRWRADAGVVAATGDNFQGNSCFFGDTFGTFTTPGDSSQMYRLFSNGVGAPGAISYQWNSGGADAGFTPPYAYSVGAPGVQVLSIGDREYGFWLDRIVISTNDSLTSAQLDATPNSLTDIIPQSNDSTIAFEADRPSGAGATYANNTTRVYWLATNDVTATGGTALYCATTNFPPLSGAQAGRPNSFVTYSLNFSQAGTFYVYYRWRADAGVVAATGDNFQGNSCFFGDTFGTFTTPGDSSQMYRLFSNGVGAPGAISYQWNSGGADAGFTPPYAYTVGAPGVQVLSIGDREYGFWLDRIVISTNDSLSSAQLDAIPDSGGLATPPKVKSATGAWGTSNAVVTFSDAVNPATVLPGNFTLNGGVTVTAASVSLGDAATVNLTTSAQVPGTLYTLTVNNVASAQTGLAVPNGSTANFTAWKLASGWSLENIYYGAGGGAQGITNSANYTNNLPDVTQWVKGLQNNHLMDGEGYISRLTTIFTPTNSDNYLLYSVNDDDVDLWYSADVSANVLNNYLTVPSLVELTGAGSVTGLPVQAAAAVPPFFNNGANLPATIPGLVAGTPYVVQVFQAQVLIDSYVQIAISASSLATPPDQLSVLNGSSISAWVNPDLGAVTFSQSPVNTTAATHSRATFTVKAASVAGQSPIFYQWRRNGIDIVGATRPTYITPILDSSFNGSVYSVVVGVAGTDTVCPGTGTLTVVPGAQPSVTPYVGINFSGGQSSVVPGSLTPYDVAGVVRQANWNNLFEFNFDGTPGNGGSLVDAQGNTNGVTLVGLANGEYITGTKQVGSADSVLLQGYVQGQSNVVDLTISGVTNGTYNVLVYSVGFSFNASYEEAFDLNTNGVPAAPTYHVKAQTGIEYVANPVFVRMTSTDPNIRTSGNYVEFDNINLSPTDNLDIIATPESPLADGNLIPAINAIQLVKVGPKLTVSGSGGNVTVAWPYGATGYVLESTPSLNPAVWTVVGAAPNPITGAGSITVSSIGNKFYRLRQ